MPMINVINPATESIVGSYEIMDKIQVENVIEEMNNSQKNWENVSINQRRILMLNVADILEKRCKEFAEIITDEMGKPITQAIAEVNKCAVLCRHYAEKSKGYLAPQLIETESSKSYRYFRPSGIIFAIMPWNFPFWQVIRFVVPNLMGGNAVILKHAPNSTGSALALEKIFIEAGFPENLFRALIIGIDLVETVINHTAIKGVTLTGSERAGRSVAAIAGKALKKVALELGGSDPYLILHDADINLAAEECVQSRLLNAGQVCISAKRLIVVPEIYDEFIASIKNKMNAYRCGDPKLSTTNLGPLARDDLRKELDEHVQKSIEKGAHCEMGGKIKTGTGYYYEPTLLLNVSKGMPAYNQELFGPVVSIIKAKDEADAIEIANATRFGLGAAVFTKDIKRGEEIARNKIISGLCSVNKMVISDPRIPFGGTKASGFGRECSREGIHEFMNIKSVIVEDREAKKESDVKD